MVTMMMVLLNVTLVTLNVKLVAIMKLVLFVLKIEKTQNHVHVYMVITTLLIGFVMNVNTNVMVVFLHLQTVLNVLKTEPKIQLVTAQVDTITSINKKNVQNVTVSVILVNNLDLA